MSAPRTPKAANLASLARRHRVPPFVVVDRHTEPDAAFLSGAPRFLVRGCLAAEDRRETSLAGQGPTLGPVGAQAVRAALAQVFSAPEVVECIVQVHREGLSGVLFCLSPERGLLEYSRAPGGVTGGKGAPFTAVFPNALPRHAALAALLPSLHGEFGACDVELVDPEDPHLVQVRPLTAPFAFDEDACRLKMQLQELADDVWIRDEFCCDLAESPEVDAALIELLCGARRELSEALGLGLPDLAPAHFVKIGTQIFVPERVQGSLSGRSPRAWFELGGWIHSRYRELVPRLRTGELEAPDLMRAALALRLAFELLHPLPAWLVSGPRRRLFALRDVCRQRLLERAERRRLPVAIGSARRLRDRFAKSSQRCTWEQLEYVDARGIVVVAGAFERGPWIPFRRGMPAPEPKAFVVTDELHPEIFGLFGRIHGVIAEGGALTSHLAILAREHAVPLWIQVADARKRFC